MKTANDSSIARMEEIANSVSHAIGFLAVLISAPFLFLAALHPGSTTNAIGAAIFIATTALLYLASSLYHGLPHGQAKNFFLKLDYSAIFLVIAGSYTAFVATHQSHTSIWLLGLVWAVALIGVVLKLCDRLSHPTHATTYYVVMGWLTLIAALPIAAQIPRISLHWMIIGALAYTGGVVFYVLGSRLRFSHLGWHLAVMTGTGCHFVALLH